MYLIGVDGQLKPLTSNTNPNKSTKMQGVQSTRVRKRHAKRRRKSRMETEQLARLLTGQDEANERGASPTSPPRQDSTDGEDPSSPPSVNEIAPDAKTAPLLDMGSEAAATENAKPNVHVTVLLEGANLETTRARSSSGGSGGVVLLNSDEHGHILKKTGRQANDARPDITHQCLLTLLDSPLNKAGRLTIYIRTAKNVLIKVHPQMRVPRTARRFYGLMAELLVKFKVRGTAGSEPLLRVIKNPITSHLPVGTRRVVCTYNSDNTMDIREHAKSVVDSGTEYADSKGVNNVLYVVGAIAHGKITEEWAEEDLCLSDYPLSASTVCSRITYAYECLHDIL